MVNQAVSKYLASIGSVGGKASGPARMAKLTPAHRSQVASKAAKARWEAYYRLHPEKRAAKRPASSRKKAVAKKKSAK